MKRTSVIMHFQLSRIWIKELYIKNTARTILCSSQLNLLSKGLSCLSTHKLIWVVQLINLAVSCIDSPNISFDKYSFDMPHLIPCSICHHLYLLSQAFPVMITWNHILVSSVLALQEWVQKLWFSSSDIYGLWMWIIGSVKKLGSHLLPHWLVSDEQDLLHSDVW